MAQTLARPVANLIDLLARLPGVGPKTASRLTFYLLREPNGLADALAEALAALEHRHRRVRAVLQHRGAEPLPDLLGRRP